MLLVVFFAALTGAISLGWSGGGFVGAGDIYLFTTLAAVVIGGNVPSRWIWWLWIKRYRCVDFTNYNNSFNRLGFKLGSAAIYSWSINYSNGGSLCKIATH